MITIEGKHYEVSVEEVSATGNVTPVVKVAPATPAKTVTAPANGTEMKSPMPGLVVNFKVEDGAKVKKGDVVLVLEAMKMENDLISPADGVISFRVQKGANVDTGDVLAVIG